MLFSLIIPVFNNSTEEINQIIVSLENQVFKNFEVLLIDDGSREECARFLSSLSQKTTLNLKVFHLQHSGVSNARNFGIKHAVGDYIGFVDADDYVFPNMLSDAAKVLQDKDYTIIYGLIKYEKFCNTIKYSTQPIVAYKGLDDNLKKKLYLHMFNGNQKEFITKYGYIGRGPVAKFLKRQFCLKNLFDVHLTFGEDEEWNLRILAQDIEIGVVYSTWYIYLYRENSTLHKFRLDFILQNQQRLLALREYVKDDLCKVEFEKECIRIINNIVKYYYLSPEYKGDIICKIKDFDNVLKISPWLEVMKFDEIRHLPLKRIINYILIKTRLIFIVIAFLQSVKKKGNRM